MVVGPRHATQTNQVTNQETDHHDEQPTNEGNCDRAGRRKPQVSFSCHERPDRGSFTRLNQRNHSGISSAADPPRNRRRLFQDKSYTNRAIRRDTLERSNGSRSVLFPSRDRNNNAGGTETNCDNPGFHTSPRQRSYRGKQRTGGRGRPGDARARSWARFKSYFEKRLRRFSNINSSAPAGCSQSVDQHYIPPPEASSFSIMDAFLHLYSMAFSDVAMWVYEASFGKVLLFFFSLYMLFVYCFVVLLYVVDKSCTGSACISAPDEGELSTRAHFEFAFELSWTTFTTVGYGNVGPPPEVGCYPIRFLCSVEAILGVAFVSMCSGLFYSKLLKLLGRAPVTFSSTLCVQYGKGLEVGKELSQGASLYGVNVGNRRGGDKDKFHPFPVIEFRIVNNRANHAPGKNEIWDAEVTAIVELSLEDDHHERNESLDGLQINRSFSFPRSTSENAVDSSDGKSQMVFYKLVLKPSFHPYFSRVWFLRHTLDATSPLVRREVRETIRRNGADAGWDPAWNDYRSIRECLVEFNSLQIIMSGASALSRSEVYAEKTYTYEDVCVGWRYIAVCYEGGPDEGNWQKWKKLQREYISNGEEAATRVDLSLIHDIVPQRGNDFEPVD